MKAPTPRRPAQLFLHTVLLAAGVLGAGCATLRQAAGPPGGERLGRELSLQIAEIMANNKVYETATPLLQEGIADDPNNPRLHRLLGTVLRDRGVYEEALAELQLAWQLAPHVADTAAALGVTYDAMGRRSAAEMWHRAALDLAPKRGELYNNLGFSLYLQERDAEAMVALREALRFNPNQARAFNNLGFVYHRLGEPELAMQSFAQANSRAGALANMGLASEMAGDVVAARRAYQRALEVDRRLDVARKNLAQLDKAAASSAEVPDALDVPPAVGRLRGAAQAPVRR